MQHYRAYAQPEDKPGNRIFGLGSLDPGDTKYSKALKAACKRAAGPRPPAPTYCPRCGTLGVKFASILCYKFGIAGAWNMVCSACGKVHLPTQWGPTEGALDEIESIRDREIKAREECPRKQKRIRGTEKSSRARDEEFAPSEGTHSPPGRSQRALTAISNDTRLIKQEPGLHKTLSKEKDTDNLPMLDLPFHPEEHVQAMPTIEVVLWSEDGKPPIVEHVARPDDGKIYLAECETVRAMRGAIAWERFALDISLWSLLPFTTSRIDVEPNEDVMFIRIQDVRCRQFGEHLHRYQVTHGGALPSHKSLRNTLDYPPLNHTWVIVWGKDTLVPETFLFDLGTLEGANENDTIDLPWMPLLRAGDARLFVAWRSAHTSWQCFMGGNTPFSEPGAPILLLAHPQASTLHGSGEAIALLEMWLSQARARGLSRRVVQLERRLASSTGTQRVSSAAPRGATSSGTQLIPSRSSGRANESFLSPDVFRNPRAICNLLGEHEWADEKPRVRPKHAADVVSTSPRSAHSAHTSSCAPICKETASDDEPEFVEDTTPSSTRPLSHGKQRIGSNRRTSNFCASIPLPHDNSAPVSTKTPPSDAKVEFVEDLSVPTPSARSGLPSTPKRHPASSRISLTGPAANASLEPNNPRSQNIAIVVDDEENDAIHISSPNGTIARRHTTPPATVDSLPACAAICAGDTMDMHIAGSLARPVRALSAHDDPDIVEVSRPAFWQERTRGGESPRIKTKRPRPPSWRENQAISKTYPSARALTSGSADNSDGLEITPPTRKKLKSGRPQPHAANTTTYSLATPNARDTSGHATHARQDLIAQTPSRANSPGSTPTTFNPRSSTAFGYELPEFIQGSSRGPLSGGSFETHRSSHPSLQALSTSSTRSLEPRELDCNGQEVIDLTDD